MSLKMFMVWVFDTLISLVCGLTYGGMFDGIVPCMCFVNWMQDEKGLNELLGLNGCFCGVNIGSNENIENENN